MNKIDFSISSASSAIFSIFILFFLFFLLTLFQMSFLVHFNIFGFVPNLTLIFVIIYNLLENPRANKGYIASFVGGFYLDIFSFGDRGFFGIWTFSLFCAAFIIKFFLKRYVRSQP